MKGFIIGLTLGALVAAGSVSTAATPPVPCISEDLVQSLEQAIYLTRTPENKIGPGSHATMARYVIKIPQTAGSDTPAGDLRVDIVFGETITIYDRRDKDSQNWYTVSNTRDGSMGCVANARYLTGSEGYLPPNKAQATFNQLVNMLCGQLGCK
jgi:hypothetical protein